MELRKKELVFSVDDLNRFEEIASNNKFFGVTLDFSHFATNRIYPQNLTGLKLPVYNVHLSQCVDSNPHYPLFKMGEIDINEVFETLQKYDYNSTVVMELKSVYDKEIYKKSMEELVQKR